MLPYIAVLGVLLLCAYLYDYKQVDTNRLWAAGLCFVSMWLLVGLRCHVGGDALAYEQDYASVHAATHFQQAVAHSRYQWLWVVLVWLCPTYLVFQLTHTFFVCAVFFWFFFRYSRKPFYCLFCWYVSLLFLYMTVEVEREVVAVCFFLLAYPYFEQKRWGWYYVLCLLAVGFHPSAAITWLFPLFRQLRFNSALVVTALVVGIVFFLIKRYIPLPDIPLRAMEQFEKYWNMNYNWKGFVGGVLLRVLVLCPMLYYVVRHRENWLAVACLLLLILGTVVAGLERLCNYLYPLLFVCMVDGIGQANITHGTKQLTILCTCVFFLWLRGSDFVYGKDDRGNTIALLWYPYYSYIHPSSVNPKVVEQRIYLHNYLTTRWE